MVETIKARAAGLDEWALSEGRLERGGVCHHIEELRESPALQLNMSNLIYVSEKSHRFIHREYAQSEERRMRMKARLKEALERLKR